MGRFVEREEESWWWWCWPSRTGGVSSWELSGDGSERRFEPTIREQMRKIEQYIRFQDLGPHRGEVVSFNPSGCKIFSRSPKPGGPTRNSSRVSSLPPSASFQAARRPQSRIYPGSFEANSPEPCLRRKGTASAYRLRDDERNKETEIKLDRRPPALPSSPTRPRPPSHLNCCS